MKNTQLLITLSCMTVALSGCFHPGKKDHPQGYCHQLRTDLNSAPQNNYQRSRNNTANRAVLLQQYQALDCDGQ